MDNDTNSVRDFARRFAELGEEARGYGIDAVWVLATLDPIARMEWVLPSRNCGTVTAAGMVAQAAAEIDCEFKIDFQHRIQRHGEDKEK